MPVKGGFQNIYNLKPSAPDAKVQKSFLADDDHPAYSDAQNSSWGQMAEGFLRGLAPDHFIASSAGSEAASVGPLAIEVMSELRIDISNQKPNEVASLLRETYHCVVALCDERRERYPLYPFTRKILRWSVAEPEAKTGGPEERKQPTAEFGISLEIRWRNSSKG